MNNSNFTNILLVLILALLVGFGVWFFAGRGAPAGDGGAAGPSLELDLRGGNDDGTPDQGPGDN